MKKILILFIICNNLIFSQGAPPYFNYQIVLRDANNGNLPLKNTTKNIKFSILKGWNANVLSYQEEQLITTNNYGVATAVIGQGTNRIGSINSINFIQDVYFIKVEVEDQGIFQEISKTQLISVPYALAANQLDQNNATIGQVLKWNGSQWKPDTDNSSGTPPNLSGDANGSLTNNTVSKIQNKPISGVFPNTGQILKWDGNQWKPDTDNTSGTTPNLSGDANGSITNNTVTKIQSKPVSSATPNTGQILKWDGTQWKPDTDNSSGVSPTLAGDITGAITLNSISRIQGKTLNALNPLNGQILKFNGTGWGLTTDSDNQSLNIVNGTTLSISGGNSISLPSSGVNYWTANGNNIYKNNSGSVFIGLTSSPSTISTLSVKGTFGLYNSSNLKTISFSSTTAGGDIEVSSPSISNYNYIGFNETNNYPLMGIGIGNSIDAGFYYQNASTSTVFADIKSFVLDHPIKKDSVIVYACIEGPEAAAYERGTAKLINGRAEIKYSDYFTFVVNPNTTTIILTPISIESKGLAIIEKKSNSVIIGELFNGNGNYSFDWEVKGVRKGYENFRIIRNKNEYKVSANNEKIESK